MSIYIYHIHIYIYIHIYTYMYIMGSTGEEGGTGTGERLGAEAVVGIQAGLGKGVGKRDDAIMDEATTAPTRRR